MEKFKSLFKSKVRNLKLQIDEYLEKKAENYPTAAATDREYLYLLLKVTDKDDVRAIGHIEYREFEHFLNETFMWSYWTEKGLKAYRCLLKHYRARGYLVIMPRELK